MKCAIYARVSTEYDSQKTSIPNQIKMFEQYAIERGWEISKVYTDIKSGTTSDRAGIQELLKDAEEHKFDIVLAKELSRISRNGQFSYKFKSVIQENNIHFITLDGAINTLENNSDNYGLYVWTSENEAVRTSARIKSSTKATLNSGKFTFAPYGYTLQKGKLIVSETGQAQTVQQIFKDYIAGKSFDAIARNLYKENIPTPASDKGHNNANVYWRGSTVRQILEREIYTGCLVFNKTSTISPTTTTKRIIHDKKDWVIIRDTHEAIISREDFELVQQLIESRKRIR